MKELIYSDDFISLFKDDLKYFIKYDAGSHQVVMREDEISFDDVEKILVSSSEITNILFSIQEKLIKSGLDPYVSNIN